MSIHSVSYGSGDDLISATTTGLNVFFRGKPLKGLYVSIATNPLKLVLNARLTGQPSFGFDVGKEEIIPESDGVIIDVDADTNILTLGSGSADVNFIEAGVITGDYILADTDGKLFGVEEVLGPDSIQLLGSGGVTISDKEATFARTKHSGMQAHRFQWLTAAELDDYCSLITVPGSAGYRVTFEAENGYYGMVLCGEGGTSAVTFGQFIG